MWRFRLPVVLGLVALSGACVCVVTPTTGDLSVFYTFGGARCDAAGVETVHLVATGRSAGDHATKDVTCAAFVHGLTLKSLAADTYALTVEGRDAGGYALYALDAPMLVKVVAGSDNQYDVDVPAVVGDLTVYWTFDGQTSCSAAGVAEVDYYLYDPTGTVVDQSTFACTSAGVSWNALDPGRWSVDLDGYDATGNHLYTGSAVTPVTAGQSSTYTVDLAPYSGR